VATWLVGHFSFAENGWLNQVLGWDWLRWFGNESYSFYLTHGLVLHLVRVIANHFGLATLSPPAYLILCMMSFGAAAVFAGGVFLLVEKRFSFRKSLVRPVIQPGEHVGAEALAKAQGLSGNAS